MSTETLLYGGIFLYPADKKSPNGKLRYCNASIIYFYPTNWGNKLTCDRGVYLCVPHHHVRRGIYRYTLFPLNYMPLELRMMCEGMYLPFHKREVNNKSLYIH